MPAPQYYVSRKDASKRPQKISIRILHVSFPQDARLDNEIEKRFTLLCSVFQERKGIPGSKFSTHDKTPHIQTRNSSRSVLWSSPEVCLVPNYDDGRLTNLCRPGWPAFHLRQHKVALIELPGWCCFRCHTRCRSACFSSPPGSSSSLLRHSLLGFTSASSSSPLSVAKSTSRTFLFSSSILYSPRLSLAAKP